MHWLATIPYPQIDPVILRLGPVEIKWYGLAYVLAFVFCYLTLLKMIRRGFLRITPDQLSDLLGWLAIGVIAGGRLGWWLFYHRDMGKPETWYEPIAIWHGGMSFHGGLLGVLTVLLIWTWRSRVAFWNLLDCMALVTPIGLFLGRLANFINAELVGRPSNLPWAMIFPGETVPRHPSQLYEALLEGPLLLGLLWLIALNWLQRRPLSPPSSDQPPSRGTGGSPVPAPRSTGGSPVSAPRSTGGSPVSAPRSTGGSPVPPNKKPFPLDYPPNPTLAPPHPEGVIAALFLIFYGLFRFAVEFTREPDPQLGFIAFGWLTMGQLLSAALVLAGIALSLRRLSRSR